MPPNVANAAMVFNQLPPQFQCVTNVTFETAAGATTPTTTIVEVDDLRHVNYY